MPKKNSKKVKKKEELPSFLLKLSDHTLERKIPITQKEFYSNPIFFGECKQFHGTPHPVPLGDLPYAQYAKTSDESLKFELFLPEHKSVQKAPEYHKIRFKKKFSKEFVDQYPHRCPGVKKVFVPERKFFIPDLGETTSEIESDTWREIPFCRVRSALIESPEPEVENVMLSEIQEKNRALLPYEERMAHNHFPKEFITVKLVGPVIPASITITKIPSKRKRMSDFAFEDEETVNKAKPDLKAVGSEEAEKITEEEEGEEEEQEEQEEEEEQEQEEVLDEEEMEEVEEEKEVEEIDVIEEEQEKMEVEEKEEPEEVKSEEKGLDDEKLEEKEGGDDLEDGAQIPPSGTVIDEGEGEALTATEKENTGDDMEENIEDDKEE